MFKVLEIQESTLAALSMAAFEDQKRYRLVDEASFEVGCVFGEAGMLLRWNFDVTSILLRWSLCASSVHLRCNFGEASVTTEESPKIDRSITEDTHKKHPCHTLVALKPHPTIAEAYLWRCYDLTGGRDALAELLFLFVCTPSSTKTPA